MATIIIGKNPEYLKLEGLIEDKPWVASTQYNSGAAWPAEPRFVFSNGEAWLPVIDGNVRTWNIPADAVNRVLLLESHMVELYIGSTLHSRSLDGY